MNKLKKIIRFARIYGFKRALVKAIGRTRYTVSIPLLLAPFKICKKKDIAIIGCGQFAFSTIAFFLTKRFGKRIELCMDIDEKALTSFAQCYGVTHRNLGRIDNACLTNIKLAYIVSNHASHTDYSLYFLQRGISVYIEKPISVSKPQLKALRHAVKKYKVLVYFGYNRPFSAAIQELKSMLEPKALTFNCMVIGHLIPPDHWYRKPEEGTRVCGNLGHWIDLALHLINASGGASLFNITIAYSDELMADDNLTVVLTTERGDLVTLTMTSREEPFEGIHETIIFQQENLFVSIDDFRKAEFQLGSKKFVRKYKPKDVGHERAILQPYLGSSRDVDEIFLSTELMLHIMDMVKNRMTNSIYSKLRDRHETNLTIAG